MSQSKFLGKLLCWLISVAALGLFYSPIYGRHVPDATSARVEISIPGCSLAACTQVLTTTSNPALSCTKSTDGKRNWTCTLPPNHKIPTTLQTGQPQFLFTNTGDATKGARLSVTCNAASEISACNPTMLLSLNSTTIRKLSATTTNAQTVQVRWGWTAGLLPDQTLNNNVLDANAGFNNQLISKGTFSLKAGTLNQFGTTAALDNTHTAAHSFTYVRADGSCATNSEPFNDANCISTRQTPCISPPTSTTGVTCPTTGAASYVVKQTSASANGITNAGQLYLQDWQLVNNTKTPVQRTCPNMFPQGNPICLAVMRQEMVAGYGLRRLDDKVDITLSATGALGPVLSLQTVAAGENFRCDLHNATAGLTIGPGSQGTFQIRGFGDAAINTSSMEAPNTFIGLAGGPVIQAKQILYNNDYDLDGFFDVSVKFDSSELASVLGISCPANANENLTLVMQSEATVTIENSTFLVAGQPKKQGTESFTFTLQTPNAPVSCEVPATVKCSGN